jgi:two-component system, cell cycle response regulator
MLLRIVEERDPDLREHMRVVVQLATAIGAQLGLSGSSLEQLRLGAELHDIGKLAVPVALLGKVGPLDEEEWEFVRRHPVVGQRIVSGAPSMREVGLIVRATHERWDGGGYPDGLAGNVIPLASRIIAVCDAYVAMTNDRPFRGALPQLQAVAELRRCAGSQFDPQVVSSFCELHDEIAGQGPSRLITIG